MIIIAITILPAWFTKFFIPFAKKSTAKAAQWLRSSWAQLKSAKHLNNSHSNKNIRNNNNVTIIILVILVVMI